MRLNRIELQGFRHLINRTFEFTPGLNLVYGPNESGKSTLMQAFLALLYGFYDEGSIIEAKREVMRRYQPWDTSSSFAGSLVYELDNGMTYQVARTFAPRSSTTLVTVPDGKDASGSYQRASEGRVFFAEEQLGINKQVFENICVVGQPDFVLLEQSVDIITETIMRLSSATVVGGASANDALKVLETTYKEEVGTERARTKPLSVTQKRLEQQQNRCKAVREERTEHFSRVNELKSLDGQQQQLELVCECLDYLHKLAQIRSFQSQLARVKTAVQECAMAQTRVAQLASWESFPVGDYDRVITLDARYRQLVDELRGEPLGLLADIANLEQEVSVIQNDIAHLRALSQLPIGRIDEIRKCFENLNTAQAAADLAQAQTEQALKEQRVAEIGLEKQQNGAVLAKVGHAGLAKLRQQNELARGNVETARKALQTAEIAWHRVGMTEEQFLTLKNCAVVPKERKGCFPLLLPTRRTAMAPPRPAIHSDISPIYDRWKKSQAMLEAAQTGLDDSESDVKTQLGCMSATIDSALFEKAVARLDEYLEATRLLESGRSASEHAHALLQSAKERATSLEAMLADLLPDGFDDASALLEAWQHLIIVEKREPELHLQLERARRDAARWQQLRAEFEQVEQELRSLYLGAGIENGLDEGLIRFKAGMENHQQWQKARDDNEVAQKRFHELEAESEPVRKHLEVLEFECDRLRAHHPEWETSEPDKLPDEYKRALIENQRKLSEINQRRTLLKGDISRSAQNLVHPAEADEDAMTTETEIRRLRWFGDALQIASDELSRATQEFQRQFAPRLQAMLNTGLDHATAGRYTETCVDPTTLAVHLRAPGVNEWVSAEQLSTGTRDLIYLLLRLSIIQSMSGTGERLPMLLDEALAHCDRERKQNMLTFLLHNSAERQFFLFTQDEWTRDWFAAHTDRLTLITLNIP